MNKHSKCQISASLMCSDPLSLKEDIRLVEQEKIDYLHFDLMDGHFVPNLGFSLDFIKSIRAQTSLPFDLHLMIENPLFIIESLALKKEDIVSIHFEANFKLEELVKAIKSYGCKLFIALKPNTPIYIIDSVKDLIDGINFLTINPGFSGQSILKASFDKFKRLKKLLDTLKLEDLLLEVDGNMSFDNAKIFKDLGADIFVAGTSSIFPHKKLSLEAMLKYISLLKDR